MKVREQLGISKDRAEELAKHFREVKEEYVDWDLIITKLFKNKDAETALLGYLFGCQLMRQKNIKAAYEATKQGASLINKLVRSQK